MNPPNEAELRRMRSELRQQGRLVEAIEIQRTILTITQRNECISGISNALNMLSHLLQLNGDLPDAENAARQALTTYAAQMQPDLEVFATYEMKLATIMADQGSFTEALRYGRLALEHFSDFHNPPDDFLNSIDIQIALWCKLAGNQS